MCDEMFGDLFRLKKNENLIRDSVLVNYKETVSGFPEIRMSE